MSVLCRWFAIRRAIRDLVACRKLLVGRITGALR
jgi:hypothetical protein